MVICLAETLEVIQLFWGILPIEKRKHPIIPGFEKEFVNWDCSTQALREFARKTFAGIGKEVWV